MVISGLKKFTNYSIQLLAYTRVGDGILSKPTYCQTEEDGKSFSLFGSAHFQCLKRVLGYLFSHVGTGLFLFERAEIELPLSEFHNSQLGDFWVNVKNPIPELPSP